MPEGLSAFSSNISCSHKSYHFSPHPCCTWLFSSASKSIEKIKKWNPEKSGLISTERNLFWGQIIYFVQFDVNICCFSFWLNRFLFFSAKWRPFVQSGIEHFVTIVMLNKKRKEKKSFNCSSNSWRVCSVGINQSPECCFRDNESQMSALPYLTILSPFPWHIRRKKQRGLWL